MDKTQSEAAMWQVAHEWHAGLDLVYAGVALGDVSAYSVLSVVGRLQLQHLAGLEADAPPAAASGVLVDAAAAVALAHAEAEREGDASQSHGDASQ